MNDEELSPAEEARVRGLLAQAKHDEPMPDAVVARLDRVLAGLADEASESPLPATVVPLAERRRRAARMLVAAAAVVIAGFGIGQVVGNTNGGADSNAGATADSGSAPEREPDPREYSAQSGGGGAQAPQAASDSLDALAFKVRPGHFASDSREVQRRALTMKDSASLSASLDKDAPCPAGSWGAGRYVPVAYGRAPGYLVLRRSSGDSQVADLFLCDGTEPVRSVTLPGP